MKGLRDGMASNSGISLQKAKQKVKNLPQTKNNNDIPKEQWRCKYYHPKFCQKLGHRDARSQDCYANALSKKDRDAVLKVILDDAVQKQLLLVQEEGKCIL